MQRSVEYMDLIRYKDEGSLDKIKELSRLKYANKQLEVVISKVAEAITFLSNICLFDWRQLLRWEISEEQFPVASVGTSRPYSFFELYSWRILVGAFLILVQFIFVVYIASLLRHRRLAEQKVYQLEKKARENKRNYRILLGNVQGMAYRCLDDQNWTMLSLSKGCEELTGYSPEDFIQNRTVTFKDLINPDDQDLVWDGVQQALKDGLPYKLHFRILTASGEEKWVYGQGVSVATAENGTQVLEGFVTDITNMALVKKELTEKMRLLALSSEIGTILSKGGPIATTLQLCCQSLVRHLDAAFARIWLVNGDGQILELKASAGLYTHLDGKHSRIPMGKYKIGSIAKNKKPHLTNSVIGDPLVSDQEWAKREKLVSFIGHPLMVEGKVAGVMALFACYPLSDFVSKMLASLADGIAMGVERKKIEGALLAERDFNATLINTSPAFFGAISPSGQVMMLNQAMLRATGYTKEEVVGVDYLSTFVPSEEHEKLNAIFSEIAVLKKQLQMKIKLFPKMVGDMTYYGMGSRF